jgi:hypothetical protein
MNTVVGGKGGNGRASHASNSPNVNGLAVGDNYARAALFKLNY